MIILTDKAKLKIKEISDSEGIGYYSIRISIKAGGCAGFTQDMVFDDQSSDMDEIISCDDITVLVDPISFQYLENVKIDYLDAGPFSAGFKFINDQVSGSCGCGNSISF